MSSTWWADDGFDFQDPLNAEIWSDSRSRGAVLVGEHPSAAAAGWQDRWAVPPLPWVPDIVGKKWQEAGSVVVMGSAYAPFVADSASRQATMPLATYASSMSAAEFGPRFLNSVVRPDPTYYRGVSELLHGLVATEQVVVTDLCRSSFVEKRDDQFVGGDGVVKRHLDQYARWVDAGADWTLRRMRDGGARVIVALGGMAITGLKRVLASAGARAWRDLPATLPSTTHAVEFALKGTVYTALRVAHPSWRNKNDPSYEGARRALATLLGVRRSSAPAVGAPASARSGNRRVVGMHFVCRGSLNVRDLPDGSFETGVWVVAEEHARSTRYVALHESKTTLSYRQGRVRGYRTVVHEGRPRVVFHVDPDPEPLVWTGGGSGEKGYRHG